MKNLMFAEEFDFLEKDVNSAVVLQSARVVGIESNHKYYGCILEIAERGGFENYEDLFESIERVASKRKEEWGSLEMPEEIVHQHIQWMHSILVYVEGTYCDDCGRHGCLCYWFGAY